MSLELSGTTGVKGVAGSVSAPSIVGDDTNTGISFPSADTIKFSTGGVERMSITNSGISGIEAGITMLDTYYLSSNTGITGGNWNYIKSSFSRLDGTLNSRIRVSGLGTGLTANNAGAATNFSFPSTGFYQIDFTTQISVTSSSSNVYLYTSIWTCIDGSNFDNTINAVSNTFGNSNAVYTTTTASAFIDVTNTSNDKFYLAVLPEVDCNLLGSTSGLYTYLQVKRLADT